MVNEPRVLKRVASHRLCAVEHGALLGHWLAADDAEAVLLDSFRKLEGLPLHGLAALQIAELLRQLPTQRPLQLVVPAAGRVEFGADVSEERGPQLTQLSRGQVAVRHLLPEPAPESARSKDPPDDLVLDPALDAFGVAAGQGFEVVHAAGGTEEQ